MRTGVRPSRKRSRGVAGERGAATELEPPATLRGGDIGGVDGGATMAEEVTTGAGNTFSDDATQGSTVSRAVPPPIVTTSSSEDTD
jgi:hypothetical protein